VWAGDHVVFHVPRFEIFTTLAAVAVRTRRVRFGPAVLLLCLRNPVHVAQATIALDHLSGGRFVLGVGVGGEHPKEFTVSGVPVEERGARTDESLALLRRLWTESSVTFRGRFHAIDDVGMKPLPVQEPHPPIWIGGRAAASLRRAAEHGTAWAPGFVTPEGFRERCERLDAICRERGRDPRSVGRALYLFVGVDADPERAHDAVAAFLSANYAMPFAPFARYVVAGTPEDCIAGVRRYLAAGPDHLIVRFASTAPLRSFELWTREVLPALRELTGGETA
jgi:probable F420-dependent oxidoreductase